MSGLKDFFDTFGNWLFNTFIRLDPAIKSVVMLICFALIFWFGKIVISTFDKKDNKKMKWGTALVLGLLVLAYLILLIIF